MRTLAIVLSVLFLGACAEAEASIVHPEAPAPASAPGIGTVRLRMRKPTDPTQIAAFEVVRRHLAEDHYLVAGTDDDAFWADRVPTDIDMVIGTRVETTEEGAPRTIVTLTTSVGRRLLPPLSTEMSPVDAAPDASSVAGIMLRWRQRRVVDLVSHDGSELAKN